MEISWAVSSCQQLQLGSQARLLHWGCEEQMLLEDSGLAEGAGVSSLVEGWTGQGLTWGWNFSQSSSSVKQLKLESPRCGCRWSLWCEVPAFISCMKQLHCLCWTQDWLVSLISPRTWINAVTGTLSFAACFEVRLSQIGKSSPSPLQINHLHGGHQPSVYFNKNTPRETPGCFCLHLPEAGNASW